MFPKVFQVGDFFLPTYGLMMVLAFLAGLWLAERLARRNGLNAERIADPPSIAPSLDC
jgi:phosphatidylglycerol---prolipoprotein diacylglyceryl transferase